MKGPLTDGREQAFLQHSLIFQDPSYEQVVYVNHIRAALPGFDARRKYYLSRPQRERYIHFYMGSFWVSECADLTPVYEMIFRRLKDRLLDWRYRLPRLHLIEFPSDRSDGRRSYEIEKMRAELEQAPRGHGRFKAQARTRDRACVQQYLRRLSPWLAAMGVQRA